VNDKQKSRKKKISLSTKMQQAGLDASPRAYWVASFISGVGFVFGALMLGAPLIGVAAAGFVGLLGFPKYVLRTMRRRRQNKFLNDFADAIDVMVRGLRSGLPLNEAMKIIARRLVIQLGQNLLKSSKVKDSESLLTKAWSV
jgi:tight adherence protein B